MVRWKKMVHRWRLQLLLLLLQQLYANANHWPIRKLYLLTIYNPALRLVHGHKGQKPWGCLCYLTLCEPVCSQFNSTFLGVWQKWKHALKFSNLYFQSIRLFVVDIPTYIPFTKHSYLTRKDSNQSSQHSSLRVLAGHWVCHVTYQLKISSKNLMLSDQSESRILNPAL